MKLTLESANEIMSKHDGDLDLSYTDVTLLPENLTVGGYLDLSGTGIAALPAGLTVDGYLELSDTPIASLPENLAVGGDLYLSGTDITALPENLTVGGTLVLSDTPITSLPDGLIIGGSLDLSGTRIASLPENLTVGGYLDLSGTGITSLPAGLTIGRSIHHGPADQSGVKHLEEGDYVPGRYVYADGSLTYVSEKKTAGGYTRYIGKIPGMNAISDGKRYVRCGDFHDGIVELMCKDARDRGTDQYKCLTLDSELPADDMIIMFRVITGACRKAAQAFADGHGKLKEKYTVREAISLTEGQYNAKMFRQFFAA